jgi:NADH-quinone oxidoreductase subunit J
VISVLNAAKDSKTPMFDGVSIFVVIGVLALAGLVGFALVLSPMGFDVSALRGSVEMTSKNLFDTTQTGPGYFVLFEVLGLLLLSSMGAAVLMAKKHLGSEVSEEALEEKEEK